MPELPPPLQRYLDALLDKNRHINLTAVREPEAAQHLHGHDSLAIAALELRPQRILDLGTGNGFPGVALRLLYPQASEVLLLDRTAKKLRAIEELLHTAGIEGVRVLQGDAIQVPKLHPELAAHFDLISARAVASPEKVAAWAAGLQAPGGDLVLWLEDQHEVAGELPGYRLRARHRYTLDGPQPRRRQLARYSRR